MLGEERKNNKKRRREAAQKANEATEAAEASGGPRAERPEPEDCWKEPMTYGCPRYVVAHLIPSVY